MRQQQELAALKARLGGHQVEEEVDTVTSDASTETAGTNKTI